MSETLPDSGGAYMDRANGPISGTLRRNWDNFKDTVFSGTVGGEAAKYAFGGAIAFGVWRVLDATVGMDRPEGA